MAAETLFTTDQLASLLGVHRSRLYAAIQRHLLQPDCIAGRAMCFETQSLPQVLDKLSSILTVTEYLRAKQNLKIKFGEQEP